MTVIDLQVSASGDNGYWYEDGSTFGTASSGSTARVGKSSAGPSANKFFRFANVTVPASDIDVATFKWRARGTTSTATVHTSIRAIAADNASAPTTNAEAIGATLTTASVAYNNISAQTNNTWYTAPSIVSVIEEVTSNSGWASGNALVLYWEDTTSSAGAFRVTNFYSDSSSSAATLHIEYTPDNTAPTITVAPAVSYGTLTRLGPNNTPATLTFTATDAQQTGANALSYTIRTASGGGGTLVASGLCTSGVSENVNIAYNATSLSQGSNTLYLRIHDGTAYSADSSFVVLLDSSAPTVGTIAQTPAPVTEGS